MIYLLKNSPLISERRDGDSSKQPRSSGKQNRGFVYLDGSTSRPGLFVPAAAGGQQWPAGALLRARRSLPPGGGKGGGIGGDSLCQGIKKPPPTDGQRPGPKWPGRRCPLSGPGKLIIAQAAQPVKGHFPQENGRSEPLMGKPGCAWPETEGPQPPGGGTAAQAARRAAAPRGPNEPGRSPRPRRAGAGRWGGPGRREGPGEGRGRARSGARPAHPRRAGRSGRRARRAPDREGPAERPEGGQQKGPPRAEPTAAAGGPGGERPAGRGGGPRRR